MRATHRRMMLRGRFGDLFRRVDALITPTVAVTAFDAGTIGVDEIDGRKVDRHLGWSPFTWPINLAGLPAATVPCGFDRDGLPIGLQIVAPCGGDHSLDRRGIRTGAAVVGPMANARRQLRCAAA